MAYRIEINAAARKGMRNLPGADYGRMLERFQAVADARHNRKASGALKG